MGELVFLIHHDRPDHFDGVRLAIISLRRHCPDANILVSLPEANPILRKWVADHGCQDLEVETGVAGWSAKPTLILRALEAGNPVMWIDADILVTADPRKAIADDWDVFVVAEEARTYSRQGSRERTIAWGLPVGRELAITANSGVVRASPTHAGLLREWERLMARPDYTAEQSRPWNERPFHMVSDQDALTALLGSEPWASLKLRQLKRGRDIAQCAGPAGFSPMERLRTLGTGIPLFLHSQAIKPWQHGINTRLQGTRRRRFWGSFDDLHLRLSPYTIAALPLTEAAGVSGTAFDATGRWSRQVGRRWPQVPELPLAVLESGYSSVRRVLRGRIDHARSAVCASSADPSAS